jgi:hypothetical protein
VWNEKINIIFESIGFKKCKLNHNIYILSTKNHDKIFALYVDDLLIFIEDMLVIYKVREVLSHEFNMKDLGEVEYCIGIQVVRDKTKWTISFR